MRGFSWLVYAPREPKTSTRQIDSVTIVDLSGRITLGEASVVVRDVVNDQYGKIYGLRVADARPLGLFLSVVH